MVVNAIKKRGAALSWIVSSRRPTSRNLTAALDVTEETMQRGAAPAWQVHMADGYDEAMHKASRTVLTRIAADAAYRSSILLDPRELHLSLFEPFAPTSHPEYAGTYRGTVGTSLQCRFVGAPQMFAPSKEFAFEAPDHLPQKIDFLLRQVSEELAEARRADPYIQLLCLTHLFCWWGKLHPFLDGNGHVQRILFAAAATELGIPLSSRFAVHPRTYDRLLVWPLEMFTRSTEAERPHFIAMVAEYLSSWLSGPFDAPARGIPDE